MKILKTMRLTLDPVTLANADALWRIMQAAHLREYQDVPRYTVHEFRDRVAARPKAFHPRACGRFEWLITMNAEYTPLGWVSLRLGEHAGSVAEMGYSILEPYRKRGYAEEGVRSVLDEAFLTARLDAVEAACVVENAASQRVLDKLGFTQLRLQRHGAVVRSRAVDIYVYRMEHAAWMRLRGDAASFPREENTSPREQAPDAENNGR
jgi:ribosomal-protein-alanine N-acetyltransferase